MNPSIVYLNHNHWIRSPVQELHVNTHFEDCTGDRADCLEVLHVVEFQEGTFAARQVGKTILRKHSPYRSETTGFDHGEHFLAHISIACREGIEARVHTCQRTGPTNHRG